MVPAPGWSVPGGSVLVRVRSRQHNGAMRRPWQRRIAVVTASAVVLVALFAAACGGGGQPVDPNAVLKQSSAAMKQIQGFHFVYEVHKPANAKPGPGTEIARITGDVNSEGNMQATIDVTQSGIPLSLNFVQVGDTQYLQNPLSQQWQTIPIESSPVGKLSLGAGTVQVLDQITDVVYEGTTSKGGVKTYHISGKVAASAVEAIAGAVESTDTFPTDLYVGVKDSYVYEVDIYGPATPDEPKDIWRSIVLSNLNTYVDIKAPI
jgi:LppX_LprAFG lipoprotein